jgi:hypothetical protein
MVIDVAGEPLGCRKYIGTSTGVLQSPTTASSLKWTAVVTFGDNGAFDRDETAWTFDSWHSMPESKKTLGSSERIHFFRIRILTPEFPLSLPFYRYFDKKYLN